MKLWYHEEAKDWLEALPLGNGRLGAMVYGGAEKETVQINEVTLWSGFPDTQADNPACRTHLDEMRRLIFAGKYKEAQDLCMQYMICRGPGTNIRMDTPEKNETIAYGSYQTAGKVFFDYGPVANADYRRELDILTGVHRTFAGGRERIAFCSFAANVTVIRSEGERPRISFARQGAEVRYEGGRITATGKTNCGKGISYATVIKTEGDTTYITTATSFYGDADPLAVCLRTVESAAAKGFAALLQENIRYIQSMMGRVRICIDADTPKDLPTDERLRRVKAGQQDIGLLLTYFQYGRYLLLCSSRDSLPAGLQGIWTEEIWTPWSGDYHANINFEMNYWPCDVTNLSECYAPFFAYVRMLSEHGRDTARIQYGCRGWVFHSSTSPWGFSAPGESPSWGAFMCGGAWCVNHFWQHYLFTRDKNFLAQNYPLIRGCAEFFMDFLVEDPNTGYLVTAPSNSPELSFFDPQTGEPVSMCAGPTMDNSILYEMFTNVRNFCDVLGIDADFAEKAIAFRDRLPPVRVGSDGRIMEWQYPLEETDKGHRHMSPLYGLYPGTFLTRSKTPALMEGAEKFIRKRLRYGEEVVGWNTRACGWSGAWLTNFFARLGDGEEAYITLQSMLRSCTEPNLFDSHPHPQRPGRLFQIDGNLGATAGIAEMLLQSHEEDIRLLPALPEAWKTGSFSGLKARGGFAVDAAWEDGRVTRCHVRSLSDVDGSFLVNGQRYTVPAGADLCLPLGQEVAPPVDGCI